MRALLVDDHLLFSQCLRFLLEDLDPGLACESATSIASAVAQPGPFDFILLDYGLPDSQGLQGLARVLQAHEDATVVMLSGDERPGLVHELVAAGAAGFVPKSSDMDTLLGALRTMLAGGIYLPPFVLQSPCATPPDSRPATEADHSQGPDTPPPDSGQRLSPRQLDCLLMLAQGKSNKVIARELCLADSTVKTHLSAAFKALGVGTRAEAVFKAAALGLLPSAPVPATGEPRVASDAA